MPALVLTEQATAAEREAEDNFRKNVRALAKTQPAVASLLEAVDLDLHWVYARDGSLTARRADGQWWADCSVPMLAGQSLLKGLDPVQAGSCLLAPAHAGLVRAARQRMGGSPALFVVQDDVETVRVILSCQDFSEQIAHHQFWVVCGPQWPDQLRSLFDDHPGLAVPTRFIRTRLTPDDLLTPLIAAAQEVFSALLAERTRQLAALQAEPVLAIDSRQILLIGGSEFRLWDDGPRVLRQQLSALDGSDLTLHWFDTDHTLRGSPLALVGATRQCGSVVSANLCRADCNHLISTRLPWITWVTQPAVPAFESAASRDGLILADANWTALARKAGWPVNRVRTCGWPAHPHRPATGQPGGVLSLICDTRQIEIPPAVRDFSSHRLLWDLIEEELETRPLTVERVDDYLTDRARQLGIDSQAIDRRSFIDRLIIPAYQQGLARLLMKAELPVALWGHGWAELPEFTAIARGSISSGDQLDNAVAGSAGLIYCWPERSAHPMDAMGKPIVQRSGGDHQQLIRNARQVLTAAAVPMRTTKGELARMILDLLS